MLWILFYLYYSLFLLFPILAPLQRQSSNNVAAALSLSSRALMIYGLQQERHSKQRDHCI